ncbi:BTA121 domain-containing protein surface lipoprotein [Borrelia turicatae]|uniref:BTA121 domain-containing protein surface lipoprotein n=1 Tax=Borrelia turicatae TaxID=142 RepID=UPI002ED0FDD0
MVKIKCFSLLLVLIFLLLLVISCGSGSKAVTNTGTNTGITTGTNTEITTGTNTEITTGTNTGKTTGTDVEVGDEEGLAYLEGKVTDPRVQALLDKLGVSGAGRKAIVYIRDNLTGDDVDDFFYNRLNKLRADIVIEKIIKPTVILLRARGEALRVIEGTTDEDLKSKLRLVFHRYDSLVNIREKFNILLLERDIFEKTVTRYAPKFRKFKEMVTNPRLMDMYAWLDADERATINEIEKVVVNFTYTKEKFDDILNNLSSGYIVKIIEIYEDIKIKQEEVSKAIATVSDDFLRQDLQARLKRVKDEYNSDIRDAFDKPLVELVRQILNNRDVYLGRLNGIKATVAVGKSEEEADKAAAAAVKAEGSTEAGEPREGSGTVEESGATGGGS